MSKLEVTEVRIKNVLGVREAAIELGQITVFEGNNGSGKTSHLEAIKTGLCGGSLAKIQNINTGEDEEPEVVLVLESDDDSEYYRVEKRGKEVAKVRKRVGDTAGLEDVPTPQRWLSGLYDGKMSNPMEFLRTSDKERVLLLLAAMPLEFSRDNLWASLPIERDEVGAIPEGLHPLQELALIQDSIFRERTGVNRDAKGKAASAEQTRRAAPAVIPEGREKEIEELSEKISEDESRISAEMEVVKGQYQNTVQTIKSCHESDAARMRAEVEERISEMRDMVEYDIEKLTADRDTKLSSLFDEQAKVEKKKRQLSELREQSKMSTKAAALHEQAETFDKEALELQKKSEQLTASLSELDSFRRRLISDLPIDGLEVNDKTILVNGIPFDQLNTAQKIQIAVDVACLRAQDSQLPIVWVDGAEALDEEHFEFFCDALKKKKVRALVGRRTDKPFEVRTV